MLLAVRMTLAIMIILCVVVQLVDGNQRIVNVSEVTMKYSLLELVEMYSDSNYVFSVSMETVLVIPLIMHWLLFLVVSAFVYASGVGIVAKAPWVISSSCK